MALKRNDMASKVKDKVQVTGLAMKRDKSEKLKLFNIRLLDKDREILREHFRNKGLDLSSGIRMVLCEYMENEGLK